MKQLKTLLAVLTMGLVISTGNVFAQSPKGAEQLSARPAASSAQTSAIVHPTSGLTYSVHSRGFIQNPKTGEVNAEIVTFRERGFWGNGTITQMLLDNEGHPIAVLNSSSSAGPGNALIQGGSFVGGMYLFAEHLRPNQSNVSNSGGNSSSSSGSSATATGGNATATGGNGNGGAGGTGNGGNGGSGGAGGHGGHTHPDSPGNGGIPGNGGQIGHGK